MAEEFTGQLIINDEQYDESRCIQQGERAYDADQNRLPVVFERNGPPTIDENFRGGYLEGDIWVDQDTNKAYLMLGEPVNDVGKWFDTQNPFTDGAATQQIFDAWGANGAKWKRGPVTIIYENIVEQGDVTYDASGILTFSQDYKVVVSARVVFGREGRVGDIDGPQYRAFLEFRESESDSWARVPGSEGGSRPTITDVTWGTVSAKNGAQLRVRVESYGEEDDKRLEFIDPESFRLTMWPLVGSVGPQGPAGPAGPPGAGSTILVQKDGESNIIQATKLVLGDNLSLTDQGSGVVRIDATGGGGAPEQPIGDFYNTSDSSDYSDDDIRYAIVDGRGDTSPAFVVDGEEVVIQPGYEGVYKVTYAFTWQNRKNKAIGIKTWLEVSGVKVAGSTRITGSDRNNGGDCPAAHRVVELGVGDRVRIAHQRYFGSSKYRQLADGTSLMIEYKRPLS
jgi:hypothetical protein